MLNATRNEFKKLQEINWYGLFLFAVSAGKLCDIKIGGKVGQEVIKWSYPTPSLD